MSRSNPIDILPNPSTRWFEWNGETGNPKYYDKETKKNEQVELPFEFILLDRLSVIKGWHNASESGITSNEVHDTRSETLLVRAFKMKEPIAEGFYSAIKDKVKANGGSYAINLYIAFTGDDGNMALGAFTLRGAARGAWMEFESDKTNRPQLYKKGISISQVKHGEKGMGKKKIEWESPVFELVDLPQEINDEAAEIDRNILQPYLINYFKRGKHEQVEAPKEELDQTQPEENLDQRPPEDDDIPF